MTPRKLLPVVGMLFVSACAPSINAVARQASKAAVDEGTEQITEEDTQNSLREAANDPDIQAATKAMTDHVAEGVLKALESDRAHQQLTGLTKTITQSAVQQLVAALGAPQTRAQLVGLTNAITEAALQQAARSMQTELRPAVQAMIRDDVGQGLAAALHSQLQPALGQTAQTVAYNAVIGANDGLGRAWAGSDGLSADLRDSGEQGVGLMGLVLTAMGLFALMLVAGAVMMVARARRTRHEVARLENATLLLATAMRTQPGEAHQNEELLRVVQQALEHNAERSGRHRIADALKLRKSG